MTGSKGKPVERHALTVFVGFTAIALLGYGVFGLHPERLANLGSLASFYAISFPLFARAHIALAALVLIVPVAIRLRGVWPRVCLAAAVAVVISLTAELVGTGTGWPFGEYRYSGLLGAKVGGRVPALVPLSWFLMALPAYALAARRFRSDDQRAIRLVVAAVALVVWDLALDPAMSQLAPYWMWAQPGPYYGMPWINLAGWFVTGLAIMGAFELLNVRSWSSEIPAGWLTRYYLITIAMPLGMMVLAGLWLGVVVSAVAVGAVLLILRVSHSTPSSVTTPLTGAESEVVA